MPCETGCGRDSKAGIPSIGPVPVTEIRPFWSVMIPTHNPDPNYLEQTLASVLEQGLSRREMQIELVDDASTDFDLQNFVTKVAGDRVFAYRQPQHKGIGGNWNTCIERSRGHWVHILHQDDLVLPGFYRTMRERVEANPQVGAAFCRNVLIDAEGRRSLPPTRLKPDSPGILDDWLDYVFVGLSFTPPSVVVKRHVYEKLGGFDVSYDYALDWDMWKRIASQHPLWYEPEPLAGTRKHSKSTTRKLMQSGMNIAEIRRSIEASRSYLPPEVTAETTRRAQSYYTNYAVNVAAQLLFNERDLHASLAQLRYARRIQSGTAVIKAILRLSGRNLRARLGR